jgi:hypothetical protein
MSHRRSLVDITLGTLPGQCPHPRDVTRPFGDTDRSSGIEEIEHMG